jgi:uncharacterized protein with NRDE domain
MCLIAFAWLAHPRWKLVLAGNRDEFHGRPTASAAWWPQAPTVFGGRDLEAGGSWLAIDRRGRLAAVTNYREPGAPPGTRSRGELVSGFVRGEAPIDEWIGQVAEQHDQWSGFNLLLFDISSPDKKPARAVYLSNRAPSRPLALEVGVYGLSNGLLNSEWPKVRLLRERLNQALFDEGPIEQALFNALADAEPAPDPDLPSTGLDLERERLLSPAMIRGDAYGTRASSVVLVDRSGAVEFIERSWSPGREGPERETRASFRLDA